MTGPQDEINLFVTIKAPIRIVWEALTRPDVIGLWISDEPVEIVSDWRVNAPITFRGAFHGMAFENHGQIEIFEPKRIFQYAFWSNLSASVLEDRPENHAMVRFALTQDAVDVRLDLTLGQFAHESIGPHLALYWGGTLPLIREVCEKGALHEAVK